MPQTESSIEQTFVRWCKKHKIKTFKLILNPGAGWPDRAVIFPDNRVCWIEFKTPTGQLSEIQEYTIRMLDELGHVVYTVTSANQAKKALKEFCDTYATALIPESSDEAPD